MNGSLPRILGRAPGNDTVTQRVEWEIDARGASALARVDASAAALPIPIGPHLP